MEAAQVTEGCSWGPSIIAAFYGDFCGPKFGAFYEDLSRASPAASWVSFFWSSNHRGQHAPGPFIYAGTSKSGVCPTGTLFGDTSKLLGAMTNSPIVALD